MGYWEYVSAKEEINLHQGLLDCKSAEAVQESQCFLQAALNAIADGILIINYEKNTCHYNYKFTEMWDIGNQFLAVKDQFTITALMLEKLKQPERYNGQEGVLCGQSDQESYDVFALKDGRFLEGYSRPQRAEHRIVGRVLTFRDITKQKHAEMAAQQSEEKFRMLLGNQNDGILLLGLDSNGIAEAVIEANDLVCEWLGYSKDELLTMPPQQIYDMMPTMGNALCKTLSVPSKDNQLQVEMNAQNFEIHGRKVRLCIARDIVERKRMENKMAHLEGLNLVGEMAAGISHEVRNPMTTIRGFLQVLINKEECSKYLGYYQLMIEELDRANSIITDFLSLTKERLSCRRYQNMNDIISSLVPLIEADAIVANKYMKIELGEIPELLLDEKEIRQMILNFSRNSLDAMAPGKYLSIQTFQEEDQTVLAIHDQGSGINPEIIEKIGTPFFTTKEHGTGLGLAICYRIAARHQAVINVESSTEGTTFFIKFRKPKSYVE